MSFRRYLQLARWVNVLLYTTTAYLAYSCWTASLSCRSDRGFSEERRVLIRNTGRFVSLPDAERRRRQAWTARALPRYRQSAGRSPVDVRLFDWSSPHWLLHTCIRRHTANWARVWPTQPGNVRRGRLILPGGWRILPRLLHGGAGQQTGREMGRQWRSGTHQRSHELTWVSECGQLRHLRLQRLAYVHSFTHISCGSMVERWPLCG